MRRCLHKCLCVLVGGDRGGDEGLTRPVLVAFSVTFSSDIRDNDPAGTRFLARWASSKIITPETGRHHVSASSASASALALAPRPRLLPSSLSQSSTCSSRDRVPPLLAIARLE